MSAAVSGSRTWSETLPIGPEPFPSTWTNLVPMSETFRFTISTFLNPNVAPSTTTMRSVGSASLAMVMNSSCVRNIRLATSPLFQRIRRSEYGLVPMQCSTNCPNTVR